MVVPPRVPKGSSEFMRALGRGRGVVARAPRALMRASGLCAGLQRARDLLCGACGRPRAGPDVSSPLWANGLAGDFAFAVVRRFDSH